MKTVANYCEGVKYENPDKFTHILPILDSFHIEMNFMSAIYKRLKESSIEDLLGKIGLIAPGSVVQALYGGHYNRATRFYKKVFYKAMLCILITHVKKNNLVPPAHLDDLSKCNGNTWLNSKKRCLASQSILHNEGFSEYVKNLFMVQESDNHTARSILNIINMIESLFMNIDSLRPKERDNFLSPIRLMMLWMIVYDNTNYSRQPIVTSVLDWTVFLVARALSTIKKIFSQSLTWNAYSSLPLELWIECTINKGSELKTGWKGY